MPRIPDPEDEPFVNIRRAAEILGLPPSSAYRAAESGHLPVVRMGKHRIVVPTAELRRMAGLDPKTSEANA